MSDYGARDPANREREARGRLPRDWRAPLGPAVGGLCGPEGGYGARLRKPGGRGTHKFLGFAAVAARRRQLVRAPALLLVPGPAAGTLAPAERLHVQVRPGR